MIKKLIPYAKKYRLPAILSPIFICGEVVIEVFIPYMMSIIVDCGIQGAPLQSKSGFVVDILLRFGFGEKSGIDLVLSTGLVMVVLAICSLLCGVGSARCAAKAGMGFGSEVRKALFDKVQDFSFSNIDAFSTGSLITRMTTDINTVQMAFMMVVRMFVRAPLMFILAFSMATGINFELSLVFLVVAPILAVVMLTIGIKSFPRFQAIFKKYDRFNNYIQEKLIGIRVVKAYVRAKYEKEQFRISNDELRDSSIFAEKLIILNGPFMTMGVSLCILCVLYFGSRMILGGEMGIGELMSFITYIQQILMALMMISMIFVMTVMARASMSRIVDVLTTEPDISDKDADPDAQVKDGSIEFRHVNFKYKKDGKRNVLENIDLKINSGETIGILGGTGSSKTSLVQLIPRLYDVTEGEVLVGGRNVKEYTLHHLREAVSMVLQNNVLFSGTIEDNLRWGDENASMEQIRAAADAAAADEFVMSFPDQYATDLGQGGVNVSGGQKQRLCIARALLKKPKILILDDSTSAVDTATDAKIREGLKKAHGDMTTIIIAQRINSIQHADRILVLENGKIDAIGTHEELLKSNDIYREVFLSQQEGTMAG